jgi:CRP-like cAMP-binding protein
MSEQQNEEGFSLQSSCFAEYALPRNGYHLKRETMVQEREIREFREGEIIMRQGQVTAGLFLLLEGILEVYYEGTKVAEISGKGSFVGEIASLLGGRRMATVVAQSYARLMHIPDVTNYFENNPSAAFMVAKTLAARITEMNSRLASIEQLVETLLDDCKKAVEKSDLSQLRESLDGLKSALRRELV